MKRIISLISLLAILALCLTSCFGGGIEDDRQTRVISAGSAFALVGAGFDDLTIEGIESVSVSNNLFYSEDYVVDNENGTEYNLCRKGKTVATVRLSRKDGVYDSTLYEFNLATLTEAAVIITADMDRVRIYSDDPTREYNVTVFIDPERDSTLDLTLCNVNISTSDASCAIANYSVKDLNIILEGENTLRSGNALSLQEYQDLLRFVENAEAAYDTIYPFVCATKRFKQMAVGVYVKSALGMGSFEENFNKTTAEMVEILDKGLQGLETLLNNQAGMKGLDGTSTITSLGSVHISGSGSLTVYGGNAANGNDASHGFVGANSVKGGDGGNAGHAIMAKNILITAEGAVNLLPGKNGKGGNGAGYSPIDGNAGKLSNGYYADTYFEAKR